MAKEVTLTGREIKELIIKGFVQDLKEVKIGTINLFTTVTTKHCIVSPDIDLRDVNVHMMNNGANKIDSFVEFLTEMYATSTTRLIKNYLPYPINERIQMLPLLSFSPSPENPKFIQLTY